MARDDLSDEVERQFNQLRVWWSRSKFQDSERADRLFEKFQAGPDAFIDPELTPSENWRIIKDRFDLVREREHQRKLRDYDEMAEKRAERHMRDNKTNSVTIDGLDHPDYIGGFDIDDCFEIPWTGTKDKDPPKDTDHSYWLATMNLSLTTKLQQAIERIAAEEDIEEQETQRRLHRYGAPEVVRTITEEFLNDRDAMLVDYREGAKRAANYVPGESQGYTELDETVKFQFSFERTSRKSYKVVWWEKDCFEWIGEQVRISANDAFRWSLAEAALAWGEENHLPEPLYNDLTKIANNCEDRAAEQAKAIRTAFILTMTEAFEEGNGDELMQECFTNSPELAWDYLTNLSSKTADIIEHVESNAGLIADNAADDTSVHPMDVIDKARETVLGTTSVPQQVLVDGRIVYPPPRPPEKT